ncbi:MAG: hypothetical protein U9Q12_02880, partial [Patescibacteria group bacterium]|nr:hypothetical protein [Patescibacteria group bacterium]
MKKVTKRIGFFIIITFYITLLTTEPFFVYAVNVSGQVRDGMNDYLENDLNLNVKDSLQPLTESLNVSDTKSELAEVSIRFATTNPKSGDVITASADVTGISNPDDAYYTWYLKGLHRDVPPPDTDQMATLIPNAIRAQVAIYFDPMTLDQRMNGGNNNGDFSDEYNRLEGQDDDGYKAKLGGDNVQEDGIKYCYVYDTENGEQYELNSGGTVKNGCDSGYVARCLKEKNEIQCPVNVPGIEGEVTTETTTSASGSDPNSSSTTSTGEISGSGGKRFGILTQCLDAGMEPECNDSTHTLTCPTVDGERNVTYSYGEDALFPTPTPFCVKKDEESGQLWIDPNANGCPSGGLPTDCVVTVDGEEGNYVGDTNPDRPTFRFSKPGSGYCGGGPCTVVVSGCDDVTYSIPSAGDRHEEGSFVWKPISESDGKLVVLLPSSFSTAAGDGCMRYVSKDDLRVPESCGIGTLSDKEKASGCDNVSMVMNVGDDLTVDEELHWHTNPLTDQTTPLANNDGELIAGKGIKDFTWKFEEGDEIGVVVEGIGAEATKHEDATHQTVFAMLSPGCKDRLENIDSYAEFIKYKSIEIKTATIEPELIGSGVPGPIKVCPLRNMLFVKPGTSEYDSLNVELSSGSSTASQSSTASGLGQEMTISALA